MREKVLIIGGATRMGLATAAALLKVGYQVVIASRNEEKLRAAVDTLGGNASYAVTDATQPREVEKALRTMGGADHIVLTASSTEAPASGIPATSTENAKKAFERFWMGYNILHLAPNHLSRNGSVTLLSGSSARTPVRGYGVWGTLHGSINALVRQAAIDLAPIRVNAVSPGGIGIRADRQLAEHRGQFEDVANMILAVVANPAVTAAIIDVDGGERLGTWNG
jgi:NAD(P)-dependent dehydrogenase (short-subunit alcohol dehydrogenase family)